MYCNHCCCFLSEPAMWNWVVKKNWMSLMYNIHSALTILAEQPACKNTSPVVSRGFLGNHSGRGTEVNWNGSVKWLCYLYVSVCVHLHSSSCEDRLMQEHGVARWWEVRGSISYFLATRSSPVNAEVANDIDLKYQLNPRSIVTLQVCAGDVVWVGVVWACILIFVWLRGKICVGEWCCEVVGSCAVRFSTSSQPDKNLYVCVCVPVVFCSEDGMHRQWQHANMPVTSVVNAQYWRAMWLESVLIIHCHTLILPRIIIICHHQAVRTPIMPPSLLQKPSRFLRPFSF